MIFRLFCFTIFFLSLEIVKCEVNSNITYDVIVVGCGASGVAALSTLAKAGKKVLGLEAASRIGGRVNTVKFHNGVVEMGAEWIHGNVNSTVYDLAKSNGVPVKVQHINGILQFSNGTSLEPELTEEVFNFLHDNTNANEIPDKPEPLGEYLKRKMLDEFMYKYPLFNNTDFRNGIFEYTNYYVDAYEATNDFNDISTYGSNVFETLQGELSWSWHKYGYKTLFEILLNKYNDGPGLPLDIFLNKEVTEIQWNKGTNSDVLIRCADNTEYRSKVVIVTVSLGVLKERHMNLFDPPLPQNKINAIEAISMGVLDKVQLAYESSWWKDNESSINFVWREEDKLKTPKEDLWLTKTAGTTLSFGSEGVVTVWFAGDAAKEVENLPDDVIKNKCKELFQRFLGPEVKIPDAVGIMKSSWYNNPLTRGSYSYRGLVCDQLPHVSEDLEEPLYDNDENLRVLFAGEATNKNHFSTVHGAVETGYREAERLLETNKTPKR